MIKEVMNNMDRVAQATIIVGRNPGLMQTPLDEQTFFSNLSPDQIKAVRSTWFVHKEASLWISNFTDEVKYVEDFYATKLRELIKEFTHL